MTSGQPLLAVLMFEVKQDKTQEERRRKGLEVQLFWTNLNLRVQGQIENNVDAVSYTLTCFCSSQADAQSSRVNCERRLILYFFVISLVHTADYIMLHVLIY